MLSFLLDSLRRLTLAKPQEALTPIPDISRVIKLPKTAAESPFPPHTAAETGVDTERMAEMAEAAVANLSEKFETWMNSDLKKLDQAWKIARADLSSDHAWQALYTSAHNIRGVAGSYGYPAVSRLCGSLCTLLTDPSARANLALINLHVEACHSARSVIGREDGQMSAADEICDALEKRVNDKLACSA